MGPASGYSDNEPRAIDQLGRRIDCEATSSSARFQYLVGHLHALGPRPTYEALRAIASGADVRECLEQYARLDGDFIRAFGGDVLPIDRLAVVREGRQ